MIMICFVGFRFFLVRVSMFFIKCFIKLKLLLLFKLVLGLILYLVGLFIRVELIFRISLRVLELNLVLFWDFFFCFFVIFGLFIGVGVEEIELIFLNVNFFFVKEYRSGLGDWGLGIWVFMEFFDLGLDFFLYDFLGVGFFLKFDFIWFIDCLGIFFLVDLGVLLLVFIFVFKV